MFPAILKAPLNSCTYDGKLYGVPFGVNCLAMFYNKDMLDEAGIEVPTTWSELKDAAVKLSDGSRYGFAFCSVQNEEGVQLHAVGLVGKVRLFHNW